MSTTAPTAPTRSDRIFAFAGRAAVAIRRHRPWTNVYGLARTLIALGTLLTLAATPTTVLFYRSTSFPDGRVCQGTAEHISLFCRVPADSMWLAHVAAVAILAVAASGWRPRFTAIPHWWVAFSFFSSSTAIDGGDHAAGVLALLLLPVALTDRRRWHWSRGDDDPGTVRGLTASIALALLRLQVAIIYLQAAVAKFGVTEWADGTAMYYWAQHPTFGAPSWMQPPMMSVLSSGIGVSALTWGTIILELLLAASLVGSARLRRVLLPLGVAFHVGIAAMMGLVSFSLVMIGALVLLLRDPTDEFSIPWGVPARAPSRTATDRVGY